MQRRRERIFTQTFAVGKRGERLVEREGLLVDFAKHGMGIVSGHIDFNHSSRLTEFGGKECSVFGAILSTHEQD